MTRREAASATPKCDYANLLFDHSRSVLNPEEIAKKLNCTKALVVKLIESGELGAINIGSGTVKYYRVPAAEWERFLRKRASV